MEALAVYLPVQPHLLLGVNISARQLASEDLVDCIDGALTRNGIPAHHMVLEITESVVMRPSVDQNLQAIRGGTAAILGRLDALAIPGVGGPI